MKLHPIDLIIIVVYMLGTLGVGWWFSRKQRNIRDYFLSDNNAPWWALMGATVATETSTVTFISVPAFAFAANAGGAWSPIGEYCACTSSPPLTGMPLPAVGAIGV